MTIICFGNCRIDLQRREIWRDDSVRPVAPKVFDLLALLAQQPGVAIRKETLRQRVWDGRAVSDSVLANTVMKARKAIGDDGAEPARIKTMNRVGYRFEPDPQQAVATPSPTVTLPPAGAQTTPLRIGLLPFDNATGETRLAWTEIGLATLTGQALEAERRLSVMPMATMLKALDGQPGDMPPRQRAAAVLQLLGLDVVVHAALRREGNELCLDFRTVAAAGGQRPTSGSVTGAEPSGIGELLAQQLAVALTGEDAAPVRYESEDGYVNETFARAMDFFVQRRWRSAVQLLEVLLEFEPESLVARLWLLRALVQSTDPRALPIGEQLLADATANGDGRLQAQVHLALAQAHLFSPKTPNEARHRHLTEATRLSHEHALEECAITAEMLCGISAYNGGDLCTSRQHFRRAAQASEVARNDLRLLMCSTNLVKLEMDAGHLLTAKQMVEDALALSRRHGATYLSFNLASLAAINAALGFLGLAQRQCEQAMAGFATVQDLPSAAQLLDMASRVYGETDDLRPLDALLAQWEPLFRDEGDARDGYHLMVQGRRAACAGDLNAARALMQAAIDLTIRFAVPWVQAGWLHLLIEMELKARQWERLAPLVRDLLVLPRLRHDSELQGAVMRVEAAQLQAAGRPAAALERLLAAVALTPIGRVNALSRIDAAWLSMEADDLPAAERLLRPIEPWLTQHPLGMIADARLKHARGFHGQAAELQRQALALYPAAPDAPTGRRAFFHALQVLYDAARPGARRLPTAPALPSLI